MEAEEWFLNGKEWRNLTVGAVSSSFFLGCRDGAVFAAGVLSGDFGAATPLAGDVFAAFGAIPGDCKKGSN